MTIHDSHTNHSAAAGSSLSSRRGDHGVTYVELLVSLVLIGTAVVASLVAVRATTIAIATDRDHTLALTWLLSAADHVQVATRIPCADVDTYVAAAQAAPRPSGLSSGSIAVQSVSYLQRGGVDEPYTWGPTCFESKHHRSQLITLAVTIDGSVVETLDTVKHDG